MRRGRRLCAGFPYSSAPHRASRRRYQPLRPQRPHEQRQVLGKLHRHAASRDFTRARDQRCHADPRRLDVLVILEQNPERVVRPARRTGPCSARPAPPPSQRLGHPGQLVQVRLRSSTRMRHLPRAGETPGRRVVTISCSLAKSGYGISDRGTVARARRGSHGSGWMSAPRSAGRRRGWCRARES